MRHCRRGPAPGRPPPRRLPRPWLPSSTLALLPLAVVGIRNRNELAGPVGYPYVDLFSQLARRRDGVVEGLPGGAQKAENVVALRWPADHVAGLRRDLEEEDPVGLGDGGRHGDLLDP